MGIFDSGVGGLTVASALLDLLPDENIVYFGDTARYPYGSKSPEQVRQASAQVGKFLVEEFDTKLLVVACNTASAVCLSYDFGGADENRFTSPVFDDLSVPVMGVIEPSITAIAKEAEFSKVGVIATTGTVASGAYQKAMNKAAPEIDLTCLACPGFVEFVERGETDSQQAMILARRLLAPMVESKVQALLLGCTHYPYLARVISEVMGPDVALVSSADETAFAVRDMLSQTGLSVSRPAGSVQPGRRWIVSGKDKWFKELGVQRLGLPIAAVEVHSF